MSPRAIRYLLLSFSLLVPLAFAPMIRPADERIRDLKAQELHAQLDAAKRDRVEAAMAFADELGDVEVPAPAACTVGFAGPYPCENVDLAAVVPLAELGGAAGNDSWGWTDPEEGNEIAIVGTGTGVAFVDVSEPTTPIVLGRVQAAGGINGSGSDGGTLWRDVKVHDDHAFIVSEVTGSGMQVFDLTRLREFYGTADPTNHLEPDHFDDSFSSAHNIAINEDSGTAYVVGADVCKGGLHMIDISDPLDTTVAGCYSEDGYTHDVQCVNYTGPDDAYNGSLPGSVQHEICFASNEDTVTIVDVTDKAAPVELARVGYPTSAYTHQGWLTPDQRWFVFNDEIDEGTARGGTVANTTTYILDVEDLDLGRVSNGVKAGLVKSYAHDTVSTDHNLYITDDGLIWEANYNAGLRVLKYTEDGIANGELIPVGYFDVDPGVDVKGYGDSWNVYPFFASGTVIVSNLGQGLLVLTPDKEAMLAK